MRATALLFVLLVIVPLETAGAMELPKSVTPALRAACEKDVRRLCVRGNPTFASVKACVIRKFGLLSSTCKLKLARAGF